MPVWHGAGRAQSGLDGCAAYPASLHPCCCPSTSTCGCASAQHSTGGTCLQRGILERQQRRRAACRWQLAHPRVSLCAGRRGARSGRCAGLVAAGRDAHKAQRRHNKPPQSPPGAAAWQRMAHCCLEVLQVRWNLPTRCRRGAAAGALTAGAAICVEHASTAATMPWAGAEWSAIDHRRQGGCMSSCRSTGAAAAACKRSPGIWPTGRHCIAPRQAGTAPLALCPCARLRKPGYRRPRSTAA